MFKIFRRNSDSATDETKEALALSEKRRHELQEEMNRHTRDVQRAIEAHHDRMSDLIGSLLPKHGDE